MAGKGVEIDIQRLHVRREVHRALRAVNHHHHTGLMGESNGARQIRTAAGDVRHLPQRQNAAARGDQRGESFNVGQAVCAQRQLDYFCAGLFSHHQPGHQVGMVLGGADDNFIARLQAWARVALGYHIDGFCRAARPDDVFAARSVQPAGDLIACGLVARGQALGFGELAAMDVPRAQRVELICRLDHRLRF